jgi:hypothetical protein
MFTKTGAGKKKWLTDPVDIIPFLNQNLREKVTTQPRQIAPDAKPTQIATKPEPKILSTPTGQLSSLTISIKKMIEPEKGEDEVDFRPENLPQESYSFDQVKMLWRRFAFAMKERGMETFYNAMIKREPFEVETNQYELQVDNQVQIDYIAPHLQEFNAYFRKELKNYSFTVSVILTDRPDDEVKYLTGKDKFQAMARKNPNLHTLKNLFNLDIEY